MPARMAPKKAEDEVVVVRQDERDAVALAEAERLERAAVAGARPLDGRVREGRLARRGAAGRGSPSSGMKRKPRVGSAFAASSMPWARVRALDIWENVLPGGEAECGGRRGACLADACARTKSGNVGPPTRERSEPTEGPSHPEPERRRRRRPEPGERDRGDAAALRSPARNRPHARARSRERARAGGAADGVDVIAVVGGDGTLNEVVSGVSRARAGRPIRGPDLALIPSGTGGDFQKTLGMSGALDEAVARIRHGQRRPIDLGVLRMIATNGEERLQRLREHRQLRDRRAGRRDREWVAEMARGEGGVPRGHSARDGVVQERERAREGGRQAVVRGADLQRGDRATGASSAAG